MALRFGHIAPLVRDLDEAPDLTPMAPVKTKRPRRPPRPSAACRCEV